MAPATARKRQHPDAYDLRRSRKTGQLDKVHSPGRLTRRRNETRPRRHGRRSLTPWQTFWSGTQCRQFRFPPIERLFADPVPAANLRRRRPGLLLAQNANNPFLAKPALLHRPPPADGLSYQLREPMESRSLTLKLTDHGRTMAAAAMSRRCMAPHSGRLPTRNAPSPRRPRSPAGIKVVGARPRAMARSAAVAGRAFRRPPWRPPGRRGNDDRQGRTRPR